MALAKLHPVPKTDIDLRRGIDRLETFKNVSPNDEHVTSGLVDDLMEALKEVRRKIPKSLQDVDLR